jgi:hypothetical protein
MITFIVVTALVLLILPYVLAFIMLAITIGHPEDRDSQFWTAFWLTCLFLFLTLMGALIGQEAVGIFFSTIWSVSSTASCMATWRAIAKLKYSYSST